MLTTTLDGLWALQVLAGTEVLAPELGLRPHLPSAEERATALAHPVAEELRFAGVIDAHGVVDGAVLEWLTVLSRRDAAVLLYVQTPNGRDTAERILLARFAQWWVSLERCGTQVRLSGAGTATSEQSAGLLINSQIERICGQMPPAALRPVTLDSAELLSSVKDSASLRSFLHGQTIDSDQIAILTMAADDTRSAQASVVAVQSGAGGGPTRSHIEAGTVTIIDTPKGRLVSEHVRHGEKRWMIISPGSPVTIASAVLSMLRNLPAQEQWHSYRKVV
jgi:hypothetical protein